MWAICIHFNSLLPKSNYLIFLTICLFDILAELRGRARISVLPLKGTKNWFLLISAEVHQASSLCQVIMLTFSRSNPLTLAELANTLQYVCDIKFLLHYFQFCLFKKVSYAEEGSICITLSMKIDFHFQLESSKTQRPSHMAGHIYQVFLWASSMRTTHTTQWKK